MDNFHRNALILAEAAEITGCDFSTSPVAFDDHACDVIEKLIDAYNQQDLQLDLAIDHHGAISDRCRRLEAYVKDCKQVLREYEETVQTLKRTIEDNARALGLFAF